MCHHLPGLYKFLMFQDINYEIYFFFLQCVILWGSLRSCYYSQDFLFSSFFKLPKIFFKIFQRSVPTTFSKKWFTCTPWWHMPWFFVFLNVQTHTHTHTYRHILPFCLSDCLCRLYSFMKSSALHLKSRWQIVTRSRTYMIFLFDFS